MYIFFLNHEIYNQSANKTQIYSRRFGPPWLKSWLWLWPHHAPTEVTWDLQTLQGKAQQQQQQYSSSRKLNRAANWCSPRRATTVRTQSTLGLSADSRHLSFNTQRLQRDGINGRALIYIIEGLSPIIWGILYSGWWYRNDGVSNTYKCKERRLDICYCCDFAQHYICWDARNHRISFLEIRGMI